MRKVHNLGELQNALLEGEKNIQIQGAILCSHSIILGEGVSLHGNTEGFSMLSFSRGDGIGLSSNNTISDLTVQTKSDQRAIYTTLSKEDLGIFHLQNLTVSGQIQFITRIGTMKSELIADNIDIVACDARNGIEQPQKYGVNVLQGAFTVYNFNGNPESLLKTKLTNISLGRKNAPVLGSGLFVSGFGDNGGFTEAELITTREIYSNGMNTYGVANIITGGVFVLYGTKVGKMLNQGMVTTYGTNDMVLDNWGYVKNWIAEKPITSYGPSGIGFVNFGTVDLFEAEDSIETFGLGARGFNQYDGTVGEAIFDSITTHNHGSIGIQVSKPIGSLTVKKSITTYGSIGSTLLKGVIVDMAAFALSIKEGGEVKDISIGENITTNGDNIATLDIEGTIENIEIGGKIIANGKKSIGVRIKKDNSFETKDLKIETKDGEKIEKN